MIDDFVILFSTLMCVFVVFRAARLDRTLPWFVPPDRRAVSDPAPPAPTG